MQRVDPEEVLDRQKVKQWTEISRDRALIACEHDPVVVVYTILGQKHADRLGSGGGLAGYGLEIGVYLHATGTKFYTKAGSKDQSEAQQKLIAAQDAARADPNFKATSGVTHCNQATLAIASAVGAPDGGIAGKLANQAAANLASSPKYKQVTAKEAQAIANEGGLVIGAWVNPVGHGHLVTVRPVGVQGDSPAAGHGPLLNDIGISDKVQFENWTFPKTAVVKYYTPK